MKEASGSISHSREHMPGEDKGDRKLSGGQRRCGPVGEERLG